MCWCECKNPIKCCVYQKDYICNPFACACEIDKHLKTIFGDTVVTFDETIELTKITPKPSTKKATCKIEIFLFFTYIFY